ncbi:MAG: hypothetical protein ABIF71_05220 [Planctomycetota bacterium]
MRYLVCLVGLLVGGTLAAAETGVIEFADAASFGEPAVMEGIGIRGAGGIVLVPALTRIMTPVETVVWSLAASGSSLYAGAGETGVILYARADESGTLAELGKFCVKALAADPQGRLLAGGPDGVIFRFTGLGDQAALFATGQKYVWSLLVEPDGTVFAGTGPEGRVFRVTPDGTGALLADTAAKHVLNLVRCGDQLYAGTGDKGLIYAIDPATGAATVAAQLEGTEVTGLAVRDGRLLAITGTAEEPPRKGAPAKPAGKGGEGSGDKKDQGSRIFQIDPATGTTGVFFTSPEGTLMSLAVLEDGRVIAGTDAGGVLYIIEDRDRFVRAVIPDAGKIVILAALPGGFAVGTADKGFLVRGTVAPAAQGRYISRAVTVPELERWGVADLTAQVPAGASLTCAIRTGRSSRSEKDWSEWTDLAAGPIAAAAAGTVCIQVRVTMTPAPDGSSPRLERLTLKYLPVNLAPEILSFARAREGGDEGRSGPPAKGRPSPGAAKGGGGQSGEKGIPLTWNCRDRNDDPLQFRLAVQYAGGTAWVTVAEELTENKAALDTADLPDGRYRVRLEASDEQAHAAGRGKVVTRELADLITVDTTPPALERVSVDRAGDGWRIEIAVADALSPVREAAFRVNDGEWVQMAAADGVCDEPAEILAAAVAAADAQAGDMLTIRVTDILENSLRVRAEIPR